MSDLGPVQIPRGKVIGRRWKIVKKLGEGGCGAVYRVQDLKSTKGDHAALKAESNFVAGGSVLKLEVQILRQLAGRPHVAQLLQSGKKEKYCYMVMTLLGESLNNLIRQCRRVERELSISTQTRIGINVLFGVKQIHDIGFVHRDLKPANIAIGRPETSQTHFLHILDFGLAREFVVDGADNKKQMRRPRSKALFRGTTRYCSINTHDKREQGRVDDLWSVLYMLAETREPLPWATYSEKKEVAMIKKRTELDVLLENSPIELVRFGQHLCTLNYYSHPDYALLFNLLNHIMESGGFKFYDPWDWDMLKKKPKEQGSSGEKLQIPARTSATKTSKSREIHEPSTANSKEAVSETQQASKDIASFSAETVVTTSQPPTPTSITPGSDGRKDTPFILEDFQTNLLGF